MNICFFSGDITRGGGTERVATLIANELADDNNYKVRMLSLTEAKDEPFFSLNDKISRHTLSERWINPGPGYIPLIKKVRRFIVENEIDVIIDIDIVLDVLSVPATKKLNTKVIAWEHFNFLFEQSILYRRLIQKFFTAKADRIVTLTMRDKDSYTANFGNQLPIRVIYNPILKVESQNKAKLNQIISVGNIVHVKGIDYMAMVAKRVLTDNPDWKWIVLGDGDEMHILEECAKSKGIEGRLILKGRVNDVNEYLSESKLFVLTSRNEGLPMCLLEALACNIPAVSFDINNGPADIISDGENGFLINPFDCNEMVEKINKLICNPQLLEEFSINCEKNKGKFQLENIVMEWKSLFAGLEE